MSDKTFLVFFFFFLEVLEGFFKVPPSHMKVLPDHYKGLQATSKGHTPLLILVATMGKCKQAKKISIQAFQNHAPPPLNFLPAF